MLMLRLLMSVMPKLRSLPGCTTAARTSRSRSCCSRVATASSCPEARAASRSRRSRDFSAAKLTGSMPAARLRSSTSRTLLASHRYLEQGGGEEREGRGSMHR
jgi:hypothetical protein